MRLGGVRRRLLVGFAWARARVAAPYPRALRERFNRLAEEKRFGEHMETDHAWFTDRLLDHLRPGARDRVLEIACGDGWACRRGAARAPGARFVGMDISDAMLGQAGHADATPDVRLVQASADTLPFRTGTFTAAFCIESFFLFPSLERASREMQRVLAPGATAYLVQCLFRENRGALGWIGHLKLPVHVLGAEDYRRLLEQTGWAEVQTIELRRQDAAGHRPDPHDHALLLIARKPGPHAAG
jgi:SAM-dependent methyltransferase